MLSDLVKICPPPSADVTEKRWSTIMHEPHVSPNILGVTVPSNSGSVLYSVCKQRHWLCEIKKKHGPTKRLASELKYECDMCGNDPRMEM
jgi:hypothetical protein